MSAWDENTTAEKLSRDELLEESVDTPADEVFMIWTPVFPLNLGW
jgi:hypothetical protein